MSAPDAKGPKGEERPADLIGNAVHVMRIASGEIEEGSSVDDGKDPATKALGAKGGKMRATSMTTERRLEIARKAAEAEAELGFCLASPVLLGY